MATRKHAKHATTSAAPRATTDATATDTPTSTAATSEPTSRHTRNTRTHTTQPQADSTTAPNRTTPGSNRTTPEPNRTTPADGSQSLHSTVATTSTQRFASVDATTSTGKKSDDSANTGGTKVTVITTKSEFDKNLEEAGNKLVLVEFFASWCGPCRLLSPILEELANEYEGKVLVMKMDVDECEDVPMEYGVSSMPTFLFLRNKKKIELFVGSNSQKLIKRLERLCDPTKGIVSPSASTTSEKPADVAVTELKSSASKKKLKKPNVAEESAAPSTAATSTPTASSGKKTAAK